MTNNKIPRNDQIRMTKPATAQLRAIGHSGFGFLWSLVIGRLMQIRFMVPMHGVKAVGALHEPAVPERGSVTRRTWGCSDALRLTEPRSHRVAQVHGSNACAKRKRALHEPPFRPRRRSRPRPRLGGLASWLW